MPTSLSGMAPGPAKAGGDSEAGGGKQRPAGSRTTGDQAGAAPERPADPRIRHQTDRRVKPGKGAAPSRSQPL